MNSTTTRVVKLIGLSAIVGALAACTISPRNVAEDRAVVFGPPHVETLAETIAREQRGKQGCLVAGNLNKGGECEKLRETLLPPPPPPPEG